MIICCCFNPTANSARCLIRGSGGVHAARYGRNTACLVVQYARTRRGGIGVRWKSCWIAIRGFQSSMIPGLCLRSNRPRYCRYDLSRRCSGGRTECGSAVVRHWFNARYVDDMALSWRLTRGTWESQGKTGYHQGWRKNEAAVHRDGWDLTSPLVMPLMMRGYWGGMYSRVEALGADSGPRARSVSRTEARNSAKKFWRFWLRAAASSIVFV